MALLAAHPMQTAPLLLKAFPLFLFLVSTLAHPITFCGDKTCSIVIRKTCQDFAFENVFQGSCCSLQDNIASGECRVVVAAGGNCGWSPKCGICQIGDQCNIEYSTIAEEPCPESKYDVLSPYMATDASASVNGTESVNGTDSVNGTASSMTPSPELKCPEVPQDDDDLGTKGSNQTKHEESGARGCVHSTSLLLVAAAVASLAMLI